LIATQDRLFSHIGDTRCYPFCVFSFRHHSLSLRKGPLLFRQQFLLSLIRRSLARSVCSDVPAGLSCSPPPAARAFRIALNFSPQKADVTAGRPAVCAMAKEARVDVDRAVLRAVAAATTPPPILLLDRARLIESPCQGGNYLAPFIEIL
jgi:hypothetical protein